MPFSQPWFDVDFGSAYAGIGTTGYRLYKNDGTDSVARTTSGVVDLGNGGYGVPTVTVPDDAAGIEWDTGGGSPVYAREDVEPYRDRDEAVTDLNNPDQYKADVSALAIEANVEGHVTTALNAYDSPTKAELDTAEINIIAEVDANEAKIDDILADTSVMQPLIDVAVSTRAIAGDAMTLTAGALTAAAAAVWDRAFASHFVNTSMGWILSKLIRSMVAGGAKQESNQWIRYDPDAPTTPLVTFDTKDEAGSPADILIYERTKV